MRAVLYPHAPDEKVTGNIIRFFDRINSVARNDVVVINLSGRGDKDLNTYIEYFKL